MKMRFNAIKEENWKMKAKIATLEKEASNYQKIIEEIESNGIVKGSAAPQKSSSQDVIILVNSGRVFFAGVDIGDCFEEKYKRFKISNKRAIRRN